MKYVLILMLALGANGAFAGESHGGDVFEIGGAKKVFDFLEHENEFVPTELPEYKQILAPQINALIRKAPRVGRYLEKAFSRGIQPRWYFVQARLKEINDEGPTNLLLVSYNKSQIAVNSGRVVQIQKRDFDGLEAKHKAYLLMHEAVISAIGVDRVKNGSQVRSLAALFMHRNLGQFSSKEIGDEIRALVSDDKSRLYILADMDNGGTTSLLEKGTVEDASTLSDGKTPSSCLDGSDHCAFVDTRSKTYWSKNFGPDVGVKTWAEASKFCDDLKGWAGFGDWRLPAEAELTALAASGSARRIYEQFPEWGVIVGPLWSGTAASTNSERAWSVDLQTGKTSNYGKTDVTLNFRCVRSDIDKAWTNLSVTPDLKYYSKCAGAADHCVFKDNATGLSWSAVLPGASRGGNISATYSEAQSACASLGTWGALTGWRLPTLGEWRSAIRNGLVAYAQRFSPQAVGNYNTAVWAETQIGTFGETVDHHMTYESTAYRRSYVVPATGSESLITENRRKNGGYFIASEARMGYVCVQGTGL